VRVCLGVGGVLERTPYYLPVRDIAKTYKIKNLKASADSVRQSESLG
jgi:hypothetical protein